MFHNIVSMTGKIKKVENEELIEIYYKLMSKEKIVFSLIVGCFVIIFSSSKRGGRNLFNVLQLQQPSHSPDLIPRNIFVVKILELCKVFICSGKNRGKNKITRNKFVKLLLFSLNPLDNSHQNLQT